VRPRDIFGVLLISTSLVLGGWALPASAQTNPTDTQPSCSTFSNFCDLIIREAGRTGLDPALIDAVMAIESNYQVNTMGAAGEIGLMQVLPSTAKLLGFRGNDAELAEPATNIRLGVTYLAGAWNRAHGDLCRSLMKYRAGHGEEQMTALSIEYCRRAREHLGHQNRRVTEATVIRQPLDVQVVTPNIPSVERHLRGRAFWAAHEARVKAMTALVHQRWVLMARGHRM
jgi:hypothetical protein